MLGIGVLLMGALGGALEGWITPWVTDALNDLTEVGEVVSVRTDLRPLVGDMWLPSGRITEVELRDLTFMEPEGQVAELENRGAFALGVRELKVTLTGNRTDELHIIDLRPVSDCVEADEDDKGSLLLMRPIAGGPVETTKMIIEVDRPDEEPQMFDAKAKFSGDDPYKPRFFDEKTIALAKDEKAFFVVLLQSTRSLCTVNLELTVLEDDEEHRQLLLEEGQEIVVGPALWPPESYIDKVYIGGPRCHTWWEVPLDLVMDPTRGTDLCKYAGDAAIKYVGDTAAAEVMNRQASDAVAPTPDPSPSLLGPDFAARH